MGTAGQVRDSRAELDLHVCVMAGARGPADVVWVVRQYLAAWPAERVARMQRADADWAPFDENQKPAAIDRPEDVQRFCDALRGQCVDLRGAGMAPTPELLELDLFFDLARMKLAEFERGNALSRPSVRRSSGRLA